MYGKLDQTLTIHSEKVLETSNAAQMTEEPMGIALSKIHCPLNLNPNKQKSPRKTDTNLKADWMSHFAMSRTTWCLLYGQRSCNGWMKFWRVYSHHLLMIIMDRIDTRCLWGTTPSWKPTDYRGVGIEKGLLPSLLHILWPHSGQWFQGGGGPGWL